MEATATSIRGACSLAELPQLADDMIARGLSIVAAIQELSEHRVLRASLRVHTVEADAAFGFGRPN
ncbi:hypothetical protein F183_A29730 [Bryobacterales bacterium F-183]|nr:hypothetical protein F183_A29730 [Bryobacterales bacterium F-183]